MLLKNQLTTKRDCITKDKTLEKPVIDYWFSFLKFSVDKIANKMFKYWH